MTATEVIIENKTSKRGSHIERKKKNDTSKVTGDKLHVFCPRKRGNP
jgi:hypothetical protein